MCTRGGGLGVGIGVQGRGARRGHGCIAWGVRCLGAGADLPSGPPSSEPGRRAVCPRVRVSAL